MLPEYRLENGSNAYPKIEIINLEDAVKREYLKKIGKWTSLTFTEIGTQILLRIKYSAGIPPMADSSR